MLISDELLVLSPQVTTDDSSRFVPVVHEEYEVKLDSPVLDLPPILGDLGTLGASSIFELNAIYFDTPKLDLFDAGITLRRRSGGVDAGWHLKIKSEVDGMRREFQGPIGGTRPPTSLTQLLPPNQRHAPMIPIVRVVTRRTETPLMDSSGTILALISEDRVSTELRPNVNDCHICEETSSWVEMEVEQVGETRDTVLAVECALLSTGATHSQYGSKLERALEAWNRSASAAKHFD